jgi:hypothetical protein
MNKQRVRQVLDILTEENHNQRVYVSECGTKFCIAGHAIMLWGTDEEKKDLLKRDSGDSQWDVGQRILDLTDVEAIDMFGVCTTREEQEQCYEEGEDA